MYLNSIMSIVCLIRRAREDNNSVSAWSMSIMIMSGMDVCKCLWAIKSGKCLDCGLAG